MRSKISPHGRLSFIQAARRRQIITAAVETVAALGYQGASLARIAERAGISKSVISYHFANKDELLEQVVVEIIGDWEASMRPHIEAESSSARKLSAYIRSRLAYMKEHQLHLVAVAEIIVNHRRADGTPVFAERDAEPVTELVELLRTGQRAGEFRDFDPRVVAMTITQGIDGALTMWAEDRSVDLEAYAEELVTVFDLATRR